MTKITEKLHKSLCRTAYLSLQISKVLCSKHPELEGLTTEEIIYVLTKEASNLLQKNIQERNQKDTSEATHG